MPMPPDAMTGPAVSIFLKKSAINISLYFPGGVAARASEVNSETAFALKYWEVEQPAPIEELLVSLPTAGVCLVDHQQTSQLNKAIDVSAGVSM
jgi:inorganic pyrophosphatase/exopolyphosphatase